jgi:hypothetical protein
MAAAGMSFVFQPFKYGLCAARILARHTLFRNIYSVGCVAGMSVIDVAAPNAERSASSTASTS